MNFHVSDDPRPEEQQDIYCKLPVGFSFAGLLESFPVKLYQITFYGIPQLPVAKPAEEAEGEFWGIWFARFQIKSFEGKLWFLKASLHFEGINCISFGCQDCLRTNRDQPQDQ